MRPINHIVIHCTATRADWRSGSKTSAKVSEIRRWHKDRGWSDIGYHFVIDRDGTVAKGRPLDRIGAHVKGHNTGSIGISLMGGHGSSENDAFDDNFTLAQDRALRGLLDKLQGQFPAINRITGHNNFSAKACPGFNVSRWLKGKSPARESVMQSTTTQASIAQIGASVGGGATAIAALDGTAQLVAVGVVGVIALLAIYIMRERIKKWARGIK
ncbi:N-acetylmuramoyl-L-alanine amidase [Sulfitobacter mediterraneus]|uniref:N-acetylmuramoyl-L-alanine amidase n=1 Tax=Sulfitobacter mediterraneus TaxID=83219 RepID=UPI00193A5A48|nr:N-acetylmuramoyl-L-alanine amidase [Sulfitobacter mediterraneus]MBM1556655.1 N-acetylmuramoyl-L-alanine amidase [Sulfitobacter mediterraneus]MBM1570149.1 N-acetylmuramoyl-L-alanine amidase [Sulfitobacter mediterraneus]MBM1574105.1 N-acetylmuramoyl-L-alanine amidase [Sulfitobacter mediterraneus]MBM1577891.1 N-acetylmuramoyl-L-alanine amidase [Sulfitobacter mediterraneus]MBM1579613.1 N-acetylmuramoyl-L-alanine amidase [Sulfitobacter mediterraneus]